MAANKKIQWYQTKQGYALLALIMFAAAYVFASLAIDSGSLLQWTLAIVLLVTGVQNVGKLVWAVWKKS